MSTQYLSGYYERGSGEKKRNGATESQTTLSFGACRYIQHLWSEKYRFRKEVGHRGRETQLPPCESSVNSQLQRD